MVTNYQQSFSEVSHFRGRHFRGFTVLSETKWNLSYTKNVLSQQKEQAYITSFFSQNSQFCIWNKILCHWWKIQRLQILQIVCFARFFATRAWPKIQQAELKVFWSSILTSTSTFEPSTLCVLLLASALCHIT